MGYNNNYAGIHYLPRKGADIDDLEYYDYLVDTKGEDWRRILADSLKEIGRNYNESNKHRENRRTLQSGSCNNVLDFHQLEQEYKCWISRYRSSHT